MSVGKDNPTNPTGPSYGEQFGSHHTSSSGSSQSESWRDPQSVWRNQSPFLTALFGMGMDRLGGPAVQNQARMASGMNAAAMSAARQNMRPGMNPMLRNYAREVGQQFNRRIMPGIQNIGAKARKVVRMVVSTGKNTS